MEEAEDTERHGGLSDARRATGHGKPQVQAKAKARHDDVESATSFELLLGIKRSIPIADAGSQ
jgi:hypothetical protein